MSLFEIEKKLINLIKKNIDRENFIYELLDIYDQPKSSIKDLKKVITIKAIKRIK